MARELRSLDIEYAFTGGCIVGLLLDNPDLTPIRPTDEVDVIVELLSQRLYPRFEARLRARDFQNDTREGAPICCRIFNTLTVDVMPIEGAFLGLNTIWFKQALDCSEEVKVDGVGIRLVSAAGLIATKLAAFKDRGGGDFFGSHDMEDLIAVVNGREGILVEVSAASIEMRRYIVDELSGYLNKSFFREALSGHLPPDAGSQARLSSLIRKLERIGGQ